MLGSRIATASGLPCNAAHFGWALRVDRLLPAWESMFLLQAHRRLRSENHVLWHSTREGLIAAFDSADGLHQSLVIWDLTAGTSSAVSATAYAGSNMQLMAWDPSGQYLALAGLGEVCVVHVELGTQILKRLDGSSLGQQAQDRLNRFVKDQVQFSSLGWLAVQWYRGDLEVWSVPQGECMFTLEALPNRAVRPSMRWSHCGRLLAVIQHVGTAWGVAVYSNDGSCTGPLLENVVDDAHCGGINAQFEIFAWSLADTTIPCRKLTLLRDASLWPALLEWQVVCL